MCGSYQIAIYGHVVGCFLMIEVVRDSPPPNAMCCYSNDRYIIIMHVQRMCTYSSDDNFHAH